MQTTKSAAETYGSNLIIRGALKQLRAGLRRKGYTALGLAAVDPTVAEREVRRVIKQVQALPVGAQAQRILQSWDAGEAARNALSCCLTDVLSDHVRQPVTYGCHPMVRPIFNEVMRLNHELLLDYLRRRGIPAGDAERVQNKTLVYVQGLSLSESVKQQLATWQGTPRQRAAVADVLLALVFKFLKLRCIDYWRDRARGLEPSQPGDAGVSVEQLGEPSHPEQRFMVAFIVDQAGLTNAALTRGLTPLERISVVSTLCGLAGCADIETMLMAWITVNLDKNQQEFDRNWPASRITRVKQAALVKILYYLEHGEPLAPRSED